MTLSEKAKENIITSIVVLHVALFTYAALNKILDFVNFQIQLAQSPLLSAYAEWISYFVPSFELFVAIGLSFSKTRLASLYASFSLMVMFSAYIIIMLNFSPFVPCSCGGILEKMDWNQHLIFNLIFVALGFFAILLHPHRSGLLSVRISFALITAVMGSASVVLLFLSSEDMMHNRNNFIRRFPQHPATLAEIMDLKVNSYYIAGSGKGKVYLGNITAPLIVTVVDSTLKHSVQHTIKVVPQRDSFYSLQLVIQMPYFYLADGRSPIVYRGLVGQWVAEIWTENTAYFNAFEPIDANRAAFRAISSINKEHILGLFKVDDTTHVSVQPLLDKQTDGIFDTGGTLNYNADSKKLLYVYTYKNEYLVIDDKLEAKKVFHTIDTVSKVKIKTRYNVASKERQLASPAWIVNTKTRTFKNYLFVNSALMGKFESEDMWKKAAVIDVYNFNEGSYEFSFYLTNIMKAKTSDFYADEDKIYTICGKHLSVYRLDHDFYTRN